MPEIITAGEAAERIQSGDTIALNAFGAMAMPEELIKSLESRFLKTGAPRDLTVVFAAGQGSIGQHVYAERFAYEGLIRKVIAGHWGSTLKLCKLARECKIEAYNLPQGVVSQLFRAAAGRKPGILTRVGLKTFIDPRIKGVGLNEISNEKWVEVIKVDGEEFLLYKTPKPTIAFIRGTTADPMGNVTMEKEAALADPLSVAQAARANKGKVFVQVERVSAVPADPKRVKIPGILIDGIIVAGPQKQTHTEEYNPNYSGEFRVPAFEIKNVIERIKKLNESYTRKRDIAHWIIAYRASLELKEGDVFNLGVGIPEGVGAALEKSGMIDKVTATIESGVVGGVPLFGFSFGVTANPQVIYEQNNQFDFYDGGGLDVACMGALEADSAGNVNASRIGTKLYGVGGFTNITQSAKKVVFCFTFTSGGLVVEYHEGKLRVLQEGSNAKFSQKVEELSFSSEYALQSGQQVVYVTERCVFKLSRDGLELIEIAPGIRLREDILAKMTFEPIVSKDLKIMSQECFTSY